MQLCQVRTDAGLSLGVRDGEEIVVVERAARQRRYGGPRTMAEFLEDPRTGAAALSRLVAETPGGDARLRLEEVRYGPPVSHPGKILCIGLNYREHALEDRDRGAVPEQPILFSKFPDNTLIGAGDPIRLSPLSAQVDYEAELAVVIGATARDIPEDHALSVVAGYMNFNDVSARDLQFSTSQWLWGKSQDTFAPCGPFLVTADEVPDPQDLEVRLLLNGQEMQHGWTRDMIFSVAYLIAYISRGITLRPGDIIATGTPSGVGHFRTPPVYLKPGDRVAVEITGLGRLENPVEPWSP